MNLALVRNAMFKAMQPGHYLLPGLPPVPSYFLLKPLFFLMFCASFKNTFFFLLVISFNNSSMLNSSIENAE